MKNINKLMILGIILSVLMINLAFAMNVNSINTKNFQPGSEQNIKLKIKNTLENVTTDISLNLDVSKVPFSIISSDEEIDKIDEDDTENFDFVIKASNNAKAGDYQIPYELKYKIGTESKTKNGTITLIIEANPELVYNVNAENPVINSQGKIILEIINKGFGDAKFVSVKIIPEGYTLLNSDNDYIGTVSSDDSETISFDVIFKEKNPTLNAQIEYKDFNNQEITKTISLPIKVYSEEQALELGIIKSNNTPYYIGAIIIIFVGWMIIRKIRKKRRMNKAQGR